MRKWLIFLVFAVLALSSACRQNQKPEITFEYCNTQKINDPFEKGDLVIFSQTAVAKFGLTAVQPPEGDYFATMPGELITWPSGCEDFFREQIDPKLFPDGQKPPWEDFFFSPTKLELGSLP